MPRSGTELFLVCWAYCMVWLQKMNLIEESWCLSKRTCRAKQKQLLLLSPTLSLKLLRLTCWFQEQMSYTKPGMENTSLSCKPHSFILGESKLLHVFSKTEAGQRSRSSKSPLHEVVRWCCLKQKHLGSWGRHWSWVQGSLAESPTANQPFLLSFLETEPGASLMHALPTLYPWAISLV